MKLYTLTCPACAHTFRRILSDPSRPVTCPLCTAEAVLADDPSSQGAMDEVRGSNPLSLWERAGVRAAGADQPSPTPTTARASCSDSPDGEDT